MCGADDEFRCINNIVELVFFLYITISLFWYLNVYINGSVYLF